MSVTLARYNVVAAFRDMEIATDAIGALREAGFANDELSLLGRAPDEVVAHSETETGEPLGGSIAKEIAAGGLAGTALGAALGALGGLALAAIPGVGLVAGAGALYGALGGGGAGGTVGAILEGESALRTDHSWSQTFDAIKEGAIVVGVHADERQRVIEAATVLEGLTPMSMHRINDRGNSVDPEPQ